MVTVGSEIGTASAIFSYDGAMHAPVWFGWSRVEKMMGWCLRVAASMCAELVCVSGVCWRTLRLWAAPVASAKGGMNEPVSGSGGSVTVSGLGFGTTAASGTVQFTDAVCLTTTWSSSSSLACATSQSVVAAGTITISAVVATFPTVSAMSYDPPVASATLGSTPNLVASGGMSVTVTGLSFGVTYSSPTSALGGVACRTASWTSSTTLVCRTAWAVAGQKWSMHPWDTTAMITVNAITGTSVDTMFTFDAPVLSAAMFAYITAGLRGPSNYIPYRSKMNVPVTGSLYVDLRGSSFGAAEATASLAIFGQPCNTASWTSMTTVLCSGLGAIGSELVLNPAETQRSYSSTYGNSAPGGTYVRSSLGSTTTALSGGGWLTNGAGTVGDWMMLDLGSTTTIRGVVTQGRGDAAQWVTAYTVQVSTDSATFVDVDGGATFTGNTDYLSRVTNTFAAAVQARFIKIFPKTWVTRIAMRAGVLDANLPGHTNVGRSREAAVVTVSAAAGTSISMCSFDGARAFHTDFAVAFSSPLHSHVHLSHHSPRAVA